MWSSLAKRRSLLIFLFVVTLILLSILLSYSSTPVHFGETSITVDRRSTGNTSTTLKTTTVTRTHNESTNICCFILTSPKNHLTRAKAVNQTWAPRCDRYFFVTDPTKENVSEDQQKITEQLPIAPIRNITGGYEYLVQKSRLGFLYAYEQYSNECQWFIKADDDTYLLIENLKRFLSKKDSLAPVTFGYNFKVIVEGGYHSGGASYVLSRESLRRFYNASNDLQSSCKKDTGAEDVEIAKCLRKLGVKPGKSLDENNRELFHPLPFTHHFGGGFPDWMYTYAENPLQKGYNCCSDHSISFHYVSPEEMYFMDFLLYKARSPHSNNETFFKAIR